MEVAGESVVLCEDVSLVFFGECELEVEVYFEGSAGAAVSVLVELEEELFAEIGAVGGSRRVAELSCRRSTTSCRILFVCMDVLAIPTAL
jgi:hypothetical protein